MFYFYTLRSLKDSNLYYGYTSDLTKRFNQHNDGLVKSTKHRRPLQLVYYEAYTDEKQARAREAMFKNSSSARKNLYNRLGV